jgi:hypothetical protein
VVFGDMRYLLLRQERIESHPVVAYRRMGVNLHDFGHSGIAVMTVRRCEVDTSMDVGEKLLFHDILFMRRFKNLAAPAQSFT